jgi:hypothetical protein
MVSFIMWGGGFPMPAAGNALRRELLLDVVAIEAPCRPRAAEPVPDILADAAVLQRAAVVELHLQHPGARIVADGAQPARINLLHFHGDILKTIVVLATLALQFFRLAYVFFFVYLFTAFGADKLRFGLFFGTFFRVLRFAHGLRHKTLSV